MLTVLEVTLPVFALVLCGWLAARQGLLQAAAVDGLNTFVFWFALPAMLFRAVSAHPVSGIADPRFLAAFLLAAALVFFGTRLAARMLSTDPSQRIGLAFTATHGNIGYLGLPLLAQLGNDAWLPAMVMVMIADILIVIVGTIVMFEFARGGEAAHTPVRARLRAALGGLLRTPLLLGIASGLLFSAGGFTLPAAPDAFVRLLASAAGPCALFAIGASFGARRVSFGGGVGLLLAAKLMIHPLLVAATMALLGVDPAMAAIGVLAASLPSASNAFILSQRYGVDIRPIGTAIIVGTFAGAATVSFVIWLLGLRLH